MANSLQRFDSAVIELAIAQGLAQAEDNLFKIQSAKEKSRRDKEIHDLSVRKQKAEIDQLEAEGEFDRFTAKILRQRFGDENKAFKATHEHNLNQIAVAEQKENEHLNQFENMALNFAQMMGETVGRGEENAVVNHINPSLADDLDVSFSLKRGPLTISSKKQKQQDPNKVTTIDKTMGALQSGGTFTSDGFFEFVDRDEAVRFASANLGADFEKRFPRAKKLIDENFPPPDKFGFSLGQIKDFGKKGEFEYIGNNKWKKVQ